jgi:hypothetical protein
MERERLRLFDLALSLTLGALLLFSLTGCTGLAHALGVETKEETAEKIAAVRAVGKGFGPYGDIVAGGIAALLVAVNHFYRNKTREAAMQNSAAATAGAIIASEKGASSATVASILSEGIPGASTVEPGKVAEKVADAKMEVADMKAAEKAASEAAKAAA